MSNDLVIIGTDDRPVTTSLMVAEVFGKQHCHVLRDIEALDCSADFRESNFGLTHEQRKVGATTRLMPYYTMTRDGFTFLAMGFTGKRAAEFKEKYIAAFNKMEAALLKQAPAAEPARLSRLEILEMALDAERKLLEAQPKVLAYDTLMETDDTRTLDKGEELV